MCSYILWKIVKNKWHDVFTIRWYLEMPNDGCVLGKKIFHCSIFSRKQWTISYFVLNLEKTTIFLCSSMQQEWNLKFLLEHQNQEYNLKWYMFHCHKVLRSCPFVWLLFCWVQVQISSFSVSTISFHRYSTYDFICYNLCRCYVKIL